MFQRILKVLKNSVSSLSRNPNMTEITKDLVNQELTGYRSKVAMPRIEDPPLFQVGELVKIRFHYQYKKHHGEVGIITEVCDFEKIHNGPTMHFYEVLVGDEKILIVERYLDSNVEL